MYEVVPSGRFRKDYKMAVKRGCNMALLENVVDQLAAGKPLDKNIRIMSSVEILKASGSAI